MYCYAEKMARAFSHGRASWGPGGLRWMRMGEACSELLKLEQRAVKQGRRLRVFINSMSDTFEDRRDLDGARQVIFSIAFCVPHLDLLLLTKRPEQVEALMPKGFKLNRSKELLYWPPNLWLGFSAENQEMFEERWHVVGNLARQFNIPCTFCSAEPLLGPLDLTTAQFISGGEDEPDTRPLDWLILGGESGQSARLCELDWIRVAVKQSRDFEIPVFVKQLGAVWSRFNKAEDSHGGDMPEWPEDLRIRELPVSSMLNGVQPCPR
jgi:protein gp37